MKNHSLNFKATNAFQGYCGQEYDKSVEPIPNRRVDSLRLETMHRKFTGENFFPELGRFNHTQRTVSNSKIYIYTYAAFTSYSMKRVSKFHSIPCILTLAQQLYSVIHRRIYRQAFDDIALSSIFVQ